MSSVRTDAFLSGQGIAVELNSVERTLLDLWGPAAELAGGDDAPPSHVTRLVLANLVVETTPDEASRVAEALDVIVARFPCRSIVIVRGDAPGRRIDAEVAALCHLPAPGLPQVCSERILLHAGPEAIDLLPGAVRPLLEPDLPVILWWTSDPKSAEPLFRTLAAEATRVLLDMRSSDPEGVLLGLDPKINVYGRDTAWLGLAGWRELIAQCFETPGRAESLRRLRRIEITAVAPDPARPCRPSLWLAAWLGGQLGWKSSDDGSGFIGPEGPIALSVETTPGETGVEARIVKVHLAAEGPDGESTFHFDRASDGSPGVLARICSPVVCEMSRLVQVVELDAARRVSAGIESARLDIPFQKALPLFRRLLERRA